MPIASATVRVPGTTANLGPGFDTLGLALRLYNRITVRRSDRRGVGITSPIDEPSRGPATAMLQEAATAFFRTAKKPSFGFDIAIEGEVPLARGLGSSVTARLGCTAALNRIVGEPLPDSRQARLQRLYSGAKYVTAMNSSVIPLPAREGDDLVELVDDLVTAIYGEES